MRKAEREKGKRKQLKTNKLEGKIKRREKNKVRKESPVVELVPLQCRCKARGRNVRVLFQKAVRRRRWLTIRTQKTSACP